MINMHFDVFISVLSVMYRLQMYAFSYHYSALMALHTVLHVDTVLVAVALMIMTLLGPSPGLGRHTCTLLEQPIKDKLEAEAKVCFQNSNTNSLILVLE